MSILRSRGSIGQNLHWIKAVKPQMLGFTMFAMHVSGRVGLMHCKKSTAKGPNLDESWGHMHLYVQQKRMHGCAADIVKPQTTVIKAMHGAKRRRSAAAVVRSKLQSLSVALHNSIPLPVISHETLARPE